jgi:hypothetical protein
MIRQKAQEYLIASWFDGEGEFRQPFLIVAPFSSIAAFIPFRVS